MRDERTSVPRPPAPHSTAERDRVHALVKRRLIGEDREVAPRIGRFVVLSRLGSGSMGVVYAAYDEVLDRRVALKLIREDGLAHRDRMQREAQLMARLADPNIVAVYEVGTHHDQLFIAMEYVQGITLRRWQRGHRRSWREVVQTYRQAGRGLAVAHAAGIVHRDFKPDNVLVGDDGRVRVLDFGLARSDAAAAHHEGDGASSIGAKVEDVVTRTGSIMGTPAYMAPEQFSGDPVDPRTDQFAFCAALYEALYGQRPFAGATVDELAVAVTDGRLASPPSTSRVPRWMHTAVARGLRRDPDDRHASMEALLFALGRDPRRRRRIMGSIAALGAGVVVALWVPGALRQHRTRACHNEASSQLAAVYDDAARTTLRDALVDAGPSYAHVAADKVAPWMDAYADAWQQAKTQACVATTAHATWSAEVADRASWCLDERLIELQALVGALSDGGRLAAARAIDSAANLASVSPCLDQDRLARVPAPPTAARAALIDVWKSAAQAHALAGLGAYDDALELAEVALQRAETLGWPPLIAKTRLHVGEILHAKAASAEAEVALETAYFEAASAGAVEIAATAAEELVTTVGVDLARHAEGLRWSRLADVAADDLVDPAFTRRARHLFDLALVRNSQGAHDQARDLLEQSLEIRERELGVEHPDVARTLDGLGVVRLAQGAPDQAEDLHRRSLEIRTASLGPEHPAVANNLNNLANVHQARGEYVQARALHRRALAIREAAFGPHHVFVAGSLFNLASNHADLGEFEQARSLLERVLEIRQVALGPEHPDVAQALHDLANMHHAMGAFDRSRKLQERALGILERKLGPDHPYVASSASNLALALTSLGDPRRAKALHERAHGIYARALGEEHPATLVCLQHIAVLSASLGDVEVAEAELRRVLAVRERVLGADHPDVAHSLQALGKTYFERGAYREAANLHRRALRIWEQSLGPDHPYTASMRLALAEDERALPHPSSRSAVGGSRPR